MTLGRRGANGVTRVNERKGGPPHHGYLATNTRINFYRIASRNITNRSSIAFQERLRTIDETGKERKGRRVCVCVYWEGVPRKSGRIFRRKVPRESPTRNCRVGVHAALIIRGAILKNYALNDGRPFARHEIGNVFANTRGEKGG